MALGMFCSIPLPSHIWDKQLMPQMVISLPLVGLVIGTIWWAICLLLNALHIPFMLTAAVMALIPFLIAGFIHLDGYMDTSDAILSRRPLEDRLRILKDPTVGAFAVIMLVILLLMQFAAMYTIAENMSYLALLITICTLSRSCSAISILNLRHMPISNYVSLLAQKIHIPHTIFVSAVAISSISLSFLYAGFFGLIVSAAVILGYAIAMAVVYNNFRGVSGDLLGYALVLSELCGLIALAILQEL